MTYGVNIKAIRKRVREAVTEYKKKMLGRYTIVDAGGRKWSIEYNILYWRTDWEDWDYYCGCNSQKELLSEIDKLDGETSVVSTYCVDVVLLCGDRENESKKYNFRGEPV